jgi:hypothetical protein
VHYHPGEAAVSFSLEMKGAYPGSAAINRWKRTLTLNRGAGAGVVVRDEADLRQAGEITQHLITCHPAEATGPGEVTVFYKNAERETVPFVIAYDGARLRAEVEKIPLTTEEDQGVRRNWGDTLHRINLTAIEPRAREIFILEIKRKEGK